MDKKQIRPFVTGAVAGAVVISIVMFSTGWAVTKNTAETDARAMSYSAVVDSEAAICVAQFEDAVSKDESRDEKLTELVSIDSWQRGTYVSKQGWATMPGSTSPTGQVASACAERLAKQQS